MTDHFGVLDVHLLRLGERRPESRAVEGPYEKVVPRNLNRNASCRLAVCLPPGSQRKQYAGALLLRIADGKFQIQLLRQQLEPLGKPGALNLLEERPIAVFPAIRALPSGESRGAMRAIIGIRRGGRANEEPLNLAAIQFHGRVCTETELQFAILETGEIASEGGAAGHLQGGICLHLRLHRTVVQDNATDFADGESHRLPDILSLPSDFASADPCQAPVKAGVIGKFEHLPVHRVRLWRVLRLAADEGLHDNIVVHDLKIILRADQGAVRRAQFSRIQGQ